MPHIEFSEPVTPYWYPDDYKKALEHYIDEQMTTFTLAVAKKCTPDLPRLLKKQEQYLFVYGTLKKGRGNHKRFLDRPDCHYIGAGLTDEDTFAMFQASFPVILRIPKDSTVPTHHVLGEIYKVPSKLMPEFDSLESNGSMYQRQIIKINRRASDQTFWCWAYIGINSYFCDSVVGKRYLQSRTCTTRKKPEKTYYVFI